MSLPSHLYYAVPIPPFFPLCSHSSPVVTQYPQFLVSPLSISSAQLNRYTCIFLFVFFLTWRGANCGYSFALCFFSPTYHYVLEFIPYQFTDIFLILFFTPAYSTPLCRCLIYLFNHSPMYQHLGGFQYFVITNNLIHMYSCIWGFFFSQKGYCWVKSKLAYIIWYILLNFPPEELYQFAVPLIMYESACFLTAMSM